MEALKRIWGAARYLCGRLPKRSIRFYLPVHEELICDEGIKKPEYVSGQLRRVVGATTGKSSQTIT